ncbi:MAG: 2-isopropylmalate synthase LeuA2 [Candidatus Gastranaerophilaceae bacterium]
MTRQPFFYDITLRDGNQSLKRPWNIDEKEYIFNLLMDLKIPAVEAGFPASSEMDFETCRRLAEIAPENVTISGLARAVEHDITRAIEAIQPAKKPRLHTFIAMSPFNMKYVLNKRPEEVQKSAVEAVKFAKSKLGKNADIEFSAEHFGDCEENIDFVIDSFKKVIKAGATTINLPNTVERTRVKTFVNLVEKVYNALPKDINISVHCHNDLGMATAATVESYFAGAVQLECALNGLGERAGNTNFYEVAVALHNSGVDVPVDLSKIYETALIVSDMSKVPIYEKAPLIGPEALAHRSGIHQDGAVKTKDMEKGAYRAIHPSLIGRKDDEKLGITSQSGKTAVYEIISRAGYPITIQEAERITPTIKEAAEKAGELPTRNLIDIYFKEVFNVKGPFHILELQKITDNDYKLHFTHNGKDFVVEGKGNGPMDACLNALKVSGFEQKLLHYEQKAMDEEILGSGATAMTVIKLEAPNGKTIIARGRDESTANANVKAIFNGLNIIAKL